MSITHAKVSAKADGSDTSLVLPSDWNAVHSGTNDHGHTAAGDGGALAMNLAVGAQSYGNFNGAAWVTANKATYIAFQVFRPVTVSIVRFYVQVQSGNLDFGITDDSFTRLASTGSFACPSAAAHTQALSASVALVPGTRYYRVAAVDNTTAALMQEASPWSVLTGLAYPLVGGRAASFPIPASGAPTVGAGNLPWSTFE